MSGPDEMIEALAGMDAYTLADAARKEGAGNVVHFLGPQTSASVFVGTAVTARLVHRPNEEIPLKDYGGWRLHDSVGPGDVAVLDAGGLPLTVMGALAVANMMRRGAAAAVVNGCVRDVEEMDDGFPVFARGVAITTAAGHAFVTGAGEPVAIGGTRIQTGDIVAGCRGGIVVIARSRIEQIIDRARHIANSDRKVLDGIRGGRPVTELWQKHKDIG